MEERAITRDSGERLKALSEIRARCCGPSRAQNGPRTGPASRSTIHANFSTVQDPFVRFTVYTKDVEDVPVYMMPDPRLEIEKIVAQSSKWHPLSAYRQSSSLDRFIPQRQNQNMEAANYYLTKEPAKNIKNHQLDLLEQVHAINFSWRKRFMVRALERTNIIKGAGRRRVLTFSQPSTTVETVPGSLAGKPRELYEDGLRDDDVWNVRPRKKPLIGITDTVLDMPAFRPSSRRKLIDWSSKNVIAAGLYHTVCFFNAGTSYSSEFRQFSKFERISAIKWNHAGNKMAVSTMNSCTSVYQLEPGKIVWKHKCVRTNVNNLECHVNCICWSKYDREVVTGCTEGRLVVYQMSTGTILRMLHVHSGEIFRISFSPSYRYLVSTGHDMAVRILSWPDLVPYLEIGYNSFLKAFAWHPWENSTLCIGGGFDDGSLSLWNVNSQKPLGYRRVTFKGCVDNLTWNKVSGELVANWSFWERDAPRFSTVPILATFDRVVDVLPMVKRCRVYHVIWNPQHTLLGKGISLIIRTQLQETLLIWKFFGNNPSAYKLDKRLKDIKDRERLPVSCARGFLYYNIR